MHTNPDMEAIRREVHHLTARLFHIQQDLHKEKKQSRKRDSHPYTENSGCIHMASSSFLLLIFLFGDLGPMMG